MISADDIKLADQVPARQLAIRKLRDEQAASEAAERERRAKFDTEFWARQGAIHAAETALEKAAEANQRIYAEVGIDIRKEADFAAAQARGQVLAVEQARIAVASLESVLAGERKEEASTGFKMEKDRIDYLVAGIAERKGKHKQEEARQKELNAIAKAKLEAVEKAVAVLRGKR